LDFRNQALEGHHLHAPLLGKAGWWSKGFPRPLQRGKFFYETATFPYQKAREAKPATTGWAGL